MYIYSKCYIYFLLSVAIKINILIPWGTIGWLIFGYLYNLNDF